jgi:hypothetical protein
MRETTNKSFVYETSIDQIKTSCYKKIDLAKNHDEITGILHQISIVDEEMEQLNAGSESAHPGTEVNLLVSQIVFEITKLYEKQFSDLKSKERQKT